MLFARFFRSIGIATKWATLKSAFNGRLDYHFLLCISAFLWILLYNGEFWHRVDDYVESYNAQILSLAQKHTKATYEVANTANATDSAINQPKADASTLQDLPKRHLDYSLIDSTTKFWLKSSIFVATFLLLWLMLEVLCYRIYAKIFLGFLFVVAGVCSYFLDSLHISFSSAIIDSFLQTNWREASDYLSVGFALHLAIFVILPLVVLGFLHHYPKISKNTKSTISIKDGALSKMRILLSLILLIVVVYFAQGARVIEVFKDKRLLFVVNPFATIRASVDFGIEQLQLPSHYTFLGEDASTNAKNKLFVFVIGESARAKNFFYNGYGRETNPYTKQFANLIYFSDFTSCGVITAISVPCMLTNYPRKSYVHRNLSLYVDSVLDIAKKAGFEVYWLSNNGGGCIGGVCDRLDKDKVIYFNQTGQLDGDMLPKVESIIKNASKDSNKTQNNTQNNTLLVIHLQGSHGARYDLRYPKEFEKFTPVCENNELSQCENVHIQNAYDNSLIYTDFLLASIIKMLETKGQKDSALWYVSDHGESLGEYGQYMHGGFPYALAPQVQKHIPSFLWFKHTNEIAQKLKSKKDKPYSHDFVFHTLLRLLDIQTKDYDRALDMLE